MATSQNRFGNSPDRRLLIELDVSATDPALLIGLSRLYELGLLSDARLRQLSREQLSCPLPKRQLAAQDAARIDAIASARLAPREPAIAGAGGKLITQASAEATPGPIGSKAKPAPAKPSLLGGWIASFMAEVSVLWLLFLGLFMVVVSSAVLAASQWQNFSAVGQYLVLLSYTLAFWGAGQWAGRNPKLQLTAQMVQRVALLLVPINFWAVDGFGLWRSPIGCVVAGVGAIALSLLLKQTLAPLTATSSYPKRLLINVLALSWLHWGWGITAWGTDIMPLLASYVAIVGTAINLVYPDEAAPADLTSGSTTAKPETVALEAVAPDAVAPEAAASKTETARQNNALTITLVLLFGVLLLLSRAVLAAGVPISQLGLALGLCGAVLLWRDRSNSSRLPAHLPGHLWSRVGGLLMVLGWLVSLQLEPPLQSFAVSLLGLVLLWERLGRSRSPLDLTALFLIGLQGIWLARRFAPMEFRQVLVERVAAIAGSSGMPFAVVGVTLFPYLLLFVWLGERFHRRQQPQLSRQALFLATALGFGLTLFSMGNPLMRSLNLTLSAATLGIMVRRRKIGAQANIRKQAGQSRSLQLAQDPSAKQSKTNASTSLTGTQSPSSGEGWIALLQLLTLGTIFSWAHVIDPDLALSGWSLLCLVCVVLEWGLSLGSAPRPWRIGYWTAGVGLAVTGYVLGLGALVNDLLSKEVLSSLHLFWLLVPVGLLAMAEHPRCLYPKTTRVFSLIAIALVQPFSWISVGTRLASLGLATLLSGMHSRRWQRLGVAAIATGWSIAFTLDLALELWLELLPLDKGLIVWGAVLGLLCFLWGLLRPQPRKLAQLYGRAIKGWGIILAVPLVVSILGFLSHGSYGSWPSETFANSTIIATGLPCIGLAFALFRARHDGAALGLGLFSGLSLAAVLARLSANQLQSASAFLALGWLLWLMGELWLAKQPKPTQPRSTSTSAGEAAIATQPQRFNPTTTRSLELSCHLIPLAYTLVSLFLGHLSFSSYSGSVTIIAAFILLGVSRRHRQFQLWSYLGLSLASIGCFELLLYQLFQAAGGDAGDGVLLIGLLSLGLAWIFRWLLPLLRRWLRLESTGLQQFAASHWGLGSLIALVALFMPRSDRGGLLWMGLLAIAGVYALWESRRQQSAPAINLPWLDAALVQLLCALGYGIHLLYFWPTLLAWAAAVACPIAMLLEVTPWKRWGWNSRAGQRWAALLPGIVVLLTAWDISIQALLIAAVFYAGMAQRRRQVRLGYVSLLLLDFALLRIFDQLQLRDGLWYGGLLGANLLFLAQVDPQLAPSPGQALQEQPARGLRHWLRCLGAAIICLSGLYQAEVGITGLGGFAAGGVAIALGLAFVAAGIALRIRAFLYVGTLTFVIRVLLQVWRYIQTDSLFLWGIGIALGSLLIWIAATFEARRSQITALMDYWVVELNAWD